MDSARAQRFKRELEGKKVGGWQVGSLVGAGKSAVVFESQDGANRRALKIFDPELIERFGEEVQLERIGRELSLVGKSHSNLVQIFDGGKCPDSGLFFVVMGYIEAPSLADVITDVPRGRIWEIVGQVSSAAHFLEQLGLCHRDIKPDNIAVTADFTKAILLDLGVVRPFAVAGRHAITDENQRAFVGTLQYSSPEFLFRTEEDTPEGWRALTFYQLGAVLYDMIMKQRIFEQFADPYARLVEAVKYEIPKIDAADVPPDLVLLARNCLSKKPDLRLQLVTWTDFLPRDIDTSSAADAKDRIRRRLAHAKQVRDAEGRAEEDRNLRSVQRALSSIQLKLEELLRRECIGNELFPPVEVHDQNDPNPAVTAIRVFFAASADHDIKNPIHIWLRATLLDEPSMAVRLEYSAGLAQNASAIAAGTYRPLFEGVFEESVVSRTIHNLLYLLLDFAQEATTDVQEQFFALPAREESESNE